MLLVWFAGLAAGALFTSVVSRRWPGGVVPYESTFPLADVRTGRIADAVALMNGGTRAHYRDRVVGQDSV
ncbi:MAG: hypothetical protein KC583_21935, partial [Myxococcales bacterium]|nr:hypothetical protein [Myxococcales bacterium]